MERNDTVFDRITRSYYELSASERKIGDYVIAHRGKARVQSISELAAASLVSEATVTRFCRKLGYRGYNAFRQAVGEGLEAHERLSPETVEEVHDDDSFSDVCRKLHASHVDILTRTLELVRPENYIRAADILERSRRVMCMGQGGSMIIAEEAAHIFATTSGKYYAVSDSHTQTIAAATMDTDDAILFFSYSGSTMDMMDTLRSARKRGGRVILVTHYPDAPGAALADVVLQCGENEDPLQLGSIGARIAQLFLIDILFSEVCRRNLDEVRERRSIMTNAISMKSLP